MKKIANKTLFFSLFLLFFSNSFSFTLYGRLINRVIVSLDKENYTQRDLEIYLLTKYIHKKKIKTYGINEKTWLRMQYKFVLDLLLLDKQGEKIPSDFSFTKGFPEFFENLDQVRNKYENIKKIFERLKPNKAEIKSAYEKLQGVLWVKKNVPREIWEIKKTQGNFFSSEDELKLRFYKNSNKYEEINSL